MENVISLLLCPLHSSCPELNQVEQVLSFFLDLLFLPFGRISKFCVIKPKQINRQEQFWSHQAGSAPQRLLRLFREKPAANGWEETVVI